MRSGVNYDVGMVSAGNRTREHVDLAMMETELGMIATELYADCVRIIGDDPELIAAASRIAHRLGLEVWFAPFFADIGPADLVSRLVDSARIAEEVSKGGRIVLVLGCEVTVQCTGYLPGDDLLTRFASLHSGDRALVERANTKLATTLEEAVRCSRLCFSGDITYAAGDWEDVDWNAFDRVSVNLYRDAGNEDVYGLTLRHLQRWCKPTAVTEYGCATYRGAGAWGPAGWLAFDAESPDLRVRPDVVRDELEQAEYLRQVWSAQRDAGVDHSFWFTFCSYWCPHRPAAVHQDLDPLSFGLVAAGEPTDESQPLGHRKAAFAVAAHLWSTAGEGQP